MCPVGVNNGTRKSGDALSSIERLLKSSADNRIDIAERLAPHVENSVVGLIEQCTGIWKEVPIMNKKGEEVGRRVYQATPNPKFMNLFFRLANYDPADMATAMMNVLRVREINADLVANLAKAKAENLFSATKLNDKNADAFEASFVLEEDVKNAVVGQFSATMGYIQGIPYEAMQNFCKDQDAYQRWQQEFAEVAQNAVRKALGIEGDTPMLPAGEEVEEDDEE